MVSISPHSPQQSTLKLEILCQVHIATASAGRLGRWLRESVWHTCADTLSQRFESRRTQALLFLRIANWQQEQQLVEGIISMPPCIDAMLQTAEHAKGADSFKAGIQLTFSHIVSSTFDQHAFPSIKPCFGQKSSRQVPLQDFQKADILASVQQLLWLVYKYRSLTTKAQSQPLPMDCSINKDACSVRLRVHKVVCVCAFVA